MSLLMANRALIKTVGGSPFPPVIEDGNSVGWYIGDDLTTITKDASDFMSEWRDYLGSGHNLLQALGTSQPKWFLNDGVLFDGIDNFMKTLAFTFNQPEQIYIVFKEFVASSGRYLFAGDTNNVFVRTNSTSYTAYAGGFSPDPSDLTLGDFGIARILFNGANSSFQINETPAALGDFGANNMGGFILGGRNGSSPSNIQVKEVLLRKVADTAQDKQDIYDYLAAKN